jgi:hypothetical protein
VGALFSPACLGYLPIMKVRTLVSVTFSSGRLSNKRLKLAARVEYCMTAFSPARRSLSAIR